MLTLYFLLTTLFSTVLVNLTVTAVEYTELTSTITNAINSTVTRFYAVNTASNQFNRQVVYLARRRLKQLKLVQLRLF